MTERIDLDDVEVDSGDEEPGNEGDWLWRDDEADDIDGDAPGTGTGDDSGTGTGDDSGTGTGDATPTAPGVEPDEQSAGGSAGDSQGDRIPHVPREGSDSPAGIPKDRGGAGTGTGTGSNREHAGQHGESHDGGARERNEEAVGADDGPTGDSQGGAASGPHGGGVDEMATAYTYEAVQCLEEPRVALAETNEWSDWVGLVGDVPAHAINKFLREHQLDIDFFNGSGDGPGERLAAIDEHSMFYAERMVVVGTDQERWIADEADWEFVSLSDAAEKAGWSLSE